MICCKDRLQRGGVPNSFPFAYGMKGKSLSNSQLWFMINKVCDTLHREQIKVLAEVYDGQWQATVMSSESGKPLNLLCLQNLTWSPISKMSTRCILEDIMSSCKVPNRDKDLLGLYPFPVGKTTLMNIEITRLHNGALSCTSLGGSIFKKPVAKYFTYLKAAHMSHAGG